MNDLDQKGIEQSDKTAIQNMALGVLHCNSLFVEHYFQIGKYFASCNKLKDINPETMILTLEKTND